MVVDGQPHSLEDQRYLLSPQDLAAWELLPELQRIGVASLKIEGRLKDAAYVAAVTDAYRQRLDQTPASAPQVQRQLELAFSRGLSTGWLEGVNHRRLVHGRWSKKRGPLLGQLLRVERGGWLHLRSREQLQPGQGLVLEQLSSDPLQPPREIGGRIMVCERMGDERWKLRLGPERVDGSGLRPGASVWLTSDPDWQSRWQRAARRRVEAVLGIWRCGCPVGWMHRLSCTCWHPRGWICKSTAPFRCRALRSVPWIGNGLSSNWDAWGEPAGRFSIWRSS
jgi:putative protease